MARPTVLSVLIGLLFLALSGPARLLSTVGDDTCIDKQGAEFPCYEKLQDREFWLAVTASGVSSVTKPWDELSYLLLPTFGIPVLLEQIRKRKANDAGSDAASPAGYGVGPA